VGAIGAGRWLCAIYPGENSYKESEQRFATIDVLSATSLWTEDFAPFPNGFAAIIATDVPGRFVLNIGGALELWDMEAVRRIRVVVPRYDGYRFIAQERSLYVVRKADVVVYDDCL
jgi:hypothetical protein